MSLACLLPTVWRKGKQWIQATRIRKGLATAHDAAALYCKLENLLARRGFPRSPVSTPLEFCASLPPPLGESVRDATRLYNRLRFGGDGTAGQPLLQILAQIENGSILQTAARANPPVRPSAGS